MLKLINGVRRFQQRVFQPQRAFFEQLAEVQQPSTMVITCADSRVDPALITQSPPGELFVTRNIGNLVPAYDRLHADNMMSAAIEFAVAVLKVQHVVVLGHSHCGAAAASLDERGTQHLPSVRQWLRQMKPLPAADAEPSQMGMEERLNLVIRHNVLVQCRHLETHPAVAEAITRGRLQLHAWVYELDTGEVLFFNQRKTRFAPLCESVQLPPAMTPAIDCQALAGD